MEGRVVGNKFLIQERLGAGSFGTVYSGKNLETGTEIAIKLQSKTIKSELCREFLVHRSLSGIHGIPKVYWYGTEGDDRIMTMDLLGINLRNFFKTNYKKINLKVILIFARQMLLRLQSLHSRNYIHCDLKLSNFVFDRKMKTLHLIDFGLSQQFRDSKTHQHISYNQQKGFRGNEWFSSINSHFGIQLSRRDDLESLGYILCYLYLKKLPWISLSAKNEGNNEQIALKKTNASTELYNQIPHEFASYLTYCRSLRFDEEPDYDYLQQLFSQAFDRIHHEFNITDKNECEEEDLSFPKMNR